MPKEVWTMSGRFWTCLPPVGRIPSLPAPAGRNQVCLGGVRRWPAERQELEVCFGPDASYPDTAKADPRLRHDVRLAVLELLVGCALLFWGDFDILILEINQDPVYFERRP